MEKVQKQGNLELTKKVISAKSKILTEEEYMRSDFVKSKKRTYEYELKKEGKVLAYFGTSHSNNPQDEIFEKIKERFDSFKPDLVIIEGYQAINDIHNIEPLFKIYSSLDTNDLIKQDGEPVYLIKLVSDAWAQGKNIDLASSELDELKELHLLKEKLFSENDIADYYIYRQMEQCLRQTNTENQAVEKIQEFISYMEKLFLEIGWDTTRFSALRDILILGNIREGEYYNNLTSPMKSEEDAVSTNKVSMALNRARDEYQIEVIADSLKNHSRVLVVYGFGHAVVLEPALRELFA